MSGDDSLPDALAKIVRKRRERLGASQEAFADELGFHRAFYGKIENGQNMTLLTLERLAGGFAIPVWQLLREAEEGETPPPKSSGPRVRKGAPRKR